MSSPVQCVRHGAQERTYVCGHIVDGMRQGTSPGFFISSDADQAYPDAWCEECEARLEANGYEWADEIERLADVQLLCSGCYVEARALAERIGRLRTM